MSYVEDAVMVNSDSERAVCEKVGQNVRGLMNPDPNVMPHFSTEVASCSHRIQRDDLADDVTDRKLKETKTANWCRTARLLIPLHVNGVGDCLAVACAVALWGCSLPANLLRRLIYVTLVEFGSLRYVNRWRRQQCNDGRTDISLQRDDDCWEQVMRRAQPRQHDDSLTCSGDTALPLSDAIQVFVLANLLRRPIVILHCVGPTSSDPVVGSSRPCCEDIGGIYMPLLWSADECVRYPLVLAYVDGKFIPLVGGDGTADLPSALDIVPLVRAELEPLPVWFLLDDEESQVYALMQRYMNVTEVNLCQADSINMVLGARLTYQKLEGTASTSAARSVVTSPPAAVRFQDTHPTESSVSHLPSETVPAGVISVGTSQHQAASELSMTTSPCREPHCNNLASSFIYPYCYEHIDRRIVESTAAQGQQQMTTAPPDTSLMSVGCKQAGCPNVCSVFVYPYCYEHIETKISERRGNAEQPPQEYLMSISPEDCIYPCCLNRASVNTYPVCYEHLDYFSQQQSPPQRLPLQTPAAATAATGTEERAVEAELQQSRPLIYDKMMMELEKRTKGTAAKCRSVDCDNYGNGRCGGFCHECYHRHQLARHF